MPAGPKGFRMLIYVDTNIVIYAVENPAGFGPKAQARLQSAQAQGDAVSSATWSGWNADATPWAPAIRLDWPCTTHSSPFPT